MEIQFICANKFTNYSYTKCNLGWINQIMKHNTKLTIAIFVMCMFANIGHGASDRSIENVLDKTMQKEVIKVGQYVLQARRNYTIEENQSANEIRMQISNVKKQIKSLAFQRLDFDIQDYEISYDPHLGNNFLRNSQRYNAITDWKAKNQDRLNILDKELAKLRENCTNYRLQNKNDRNRGLWNRFLSNLGLKQPKRNINIHATPVTEVTLMYLENLPNKVNEALNLVGNERQVRFREILNDLDINSMGVRKPKKKVSPETPTLSTLTKHRE